MKLPQSFIDEVLSRIDVIDIIEPRITLKKTGKANYSGLCPFHQEKSPSFSVSQTKQFYYCFGCRASGNAIGFLMAYEKLSFLETVEMLASQAGMTMPEQHAAHQEERKLDISLLEQSTLYYQQQLKQSLPAKQYLEQRGLSLEVIESFKLGYAPAGWDNLQKALGNSSEAQKLLLEVGMLGQKSGRGTYDHFRERIMFPIRNRRGQTIAFGGRSLGTNMPKYLNSPETSLFHKSRELYGLYESLQSNKSFKQVIIVEGYLDVIALHQEGLSETVATLGTAISLQHIQILLRLTQSLLFCFDGDSAGKNAAWRALEITLPLMHSGIDIQFLFLPNGEDPDSFIRKVGRSGFLQKIQEAIPLADYFFSKLSSEIDISSLAGKTRFVYQADKYLQKQPTGIFQELMYERLSKVIGLNHEKIHEILMKTQQGETKEENPTIAPTQKLLPPIRLALCLLLQSPALLPTLSLNKAFYSIQLEGISFLHKIIAIIAENPHQTTGSLLEYLKEEKEKDLFVELAAQDLLIPEEAWQSELQGTITRIMESDVERRIQMLITKGKDEGLSTDEKNLLQNLLISKKQL